MSRTVFFLGGHPALSAAELVAYGQRQNLNLWWDTKRLPVALCASGAVPSPATIQDVVGGTTMIGTLRGTFGAIPTPQELLSAVPSLLRPVRGKRLIGLSALPCPAEPGGRSRACPAEPGGRRGACPTQPAGRAGGSKRIPFASLVSDVRSLGMTLKRTLGMKGTRVVLPPGGRPYLSTAQLLHNRLPVDGTAVVLLVTPARHASPSDAGGPERVDVVTLDTIQDIRAYAERDRHRPHVDPGRGMLPPKVAQILVNLSLIPPGGVLYDPFCGVGTIPTEAVLMGLKVIASDVSPKQVERTRENLSWLETQYLPQRGKQTQVAESRESAIMNDSTSQKELSAGGHAPRFSQAQVFVHDVTRGALPLAAGSVDAIVTEGWLGPPRTVPPPPRDMDHTFAAAGELIGKLLRYIVIILRPGARVVVTLPAFRIKKRIVRFPLDRLRTSGFSLDPLLPPPFDRAFAREAASGTLLYGRPDAVVLREIVRFRTAR